MKHDETLNLRDAETIFFDTNLSLSSELVWVGTSKAKSLMLIAPVAKGLGFPVETYRFF